MSHEVRPPAAARALLRLLPGEDRDELQADMAELFAARVASTGERAARRWYRVHALRLVLGLRWDRIRNGRPDPRALTTTRAARTGAGLQMMQDLRYVLRTLRRSPGFTATVILTLALGIGATTAVFTIADAVLFRPVLYPNQDRLVGIFLEPEDRASGQFEREGRQVIWPSAWDLTNWQAMARSYESLATWVPTPTDLVSESPEVDRQNTWNISPDYLRVYGIQPVLGRAFSRSDHEPNAPPVVILGYRFWRDRMAADRAVLGTVLKFDKGTATIVGVLPESLYPTVSLWRPLPISALNPPKPTGLRVVGRLKPGISLSEAQAELSAITPRESPMRPRAGAAAPFVAPELAAPRGAAAWILLGAVGCVLLIACVNVAGLQFARGVSRQQELVVRSALGAGRWRLFRLVMTESLLVAAVGGLLGVGLAWLTLDLLLLITPVQNVSLFRSVTLNPMVLTGAALVSILSGVAFGLLPAIRLSAVRFGARDLRVGSGQRTTVATHRTGRMLIAAEVALALVLFAGSTLMIRTLLRIHAVDVGFDPAGFVAVAANVVDGTRSDAFRDALLDRVRSVPGVTMTGAVTGLPLTGARITGAELSHVDGRPAAGPKNGWGPRSFVPGYFETIGMTRVAGTWPSAADCAATPSPLVLNETAARGIFGTEPALGQLLVSRNEVHRVMAIAGDIRHAGPLQEPGGEVYFCSGTPAATPYGYPAVVIRSDRPFPETAAHLRAAVLAVGERVMDIRIQRGDELYAERTALPRHRTYLLSILGGVGLLLAMVGVFGTTSSAVARRTREVGIRMAFGARPVDAVRAIVLDAALPGAIGMAIGLAGAYWCAPVLSSFLFQTSPRDPWALGSAALALALAGLLAAWIPARRAAGVNPVDALRAE